MGDISHNDLLEALPVAFGELDASSGIYAKVQHEDERKRSICAITCAFLLLHNRYESFVSGQSNEARMGDAQWGEWQRFATWCDLSQERVHAMVVFLAIRGLGKVKHFSKVRPKDS